MGPAIYLGYDQAALDAQYNARAAVPDYADYFSRWSEASAVARRDLDCALDVSYGPSPAETLDIFHGVRGGPIQIFFHGGYWRALDKSLFSFCAASFVPEGMTVVVVNYALCPAVDMDELVRQCRASIAWVHKNGASFGADPERMFISGHSAGGHIVAMALAGDWPASADVPPNVVKGACAISGLYDLEAIRLTFLNADLRMSREQAAANSPVRQPPSRPTPLILAAGALESDEFRRQSRDYITACRARGHHCDHMEVPGRHHFSVADAFADPAHPLGRAVLRQMGLA
jgi:arylformamidase